LATAADQQLYEPRPAIDDVLLRAVERRRNTLVVGAPGSGRTTLLHAHEFHLRQREAPVAYVDARITLDAFELLGAVSQAGRGVHPDRAWPDLSGIRADQPYAIAQVIRLLKGLRVALTVLIDDPPPEAAFELFGRYRDPMWELDFSWVVATTPDGAAVLDRPPADAFFERRVEIFDLNAAEKRRVLARRAPGLDPRAAETLAEYGPEGFRWFLDAAARVDDGEIDADRYVSGIAERARRAAALGHAAAVALDEVAALGPVSASDERLLRRLRWTKARASRVLNDLLDAGLLEAHERAAGPGRPRKFFVARPPEAFA
jgi:hypothetical protein